jgi:hypothetical protein
VAHVRFQFYWPSWWQLWPHYHNGEPDEDFGVRLATFCFGPFQWMWYNG